MKALDVFFSRVLPHVPGCPEPIVRQAILDAAIAFAKSSHALRRQLHPVVTISNINEYELEVPDCDHTVESIQWATREATPLIPLNEEIRAGSPTLSNTPTHYYVSTTEDCEMISFWPIPDGRYTIEIMAILRPSRTATRLADIFYDEWVEFIAAGALSRLFAIPEQSFTDNAGAERQRLLAAQGAVKARTKAMYGTVSNNMRVRNRPFA